MNNHSGKMLTIMYDWKYHDFLLFQELLKAVTMRQKHLNQVKLHEQNKKNLEQEISNHKEEAQKQRKLIYQLEKERDRYINEASDLTQKVIDVLCLLLLSCII